MDNTIPPIESPCQACGACCHYSENWPRFTTEDDAELDDSEEFVNERLSHALRGEPLLGAIGKGRQGAVPDLRRAAQVCRACMPKILNVRWRDSTDCRCWLSSWNEGTHTA
jgi:Fe-S-cluster containining protein